MSALAATPPPVVAVLSPKGGTGKTTIAVNLAAAMARRGTVELLDLDTRFGDVEYALRLRPLQRIDDIAIRLTTDPNFDVFDVMTPHPTGLRVLCAPATPVEADRLGSEGLLRVVDRLLGDERPMVLDTASGIDDAALGALERSTHPILVTSTDVASVQAGRKLVDAMSDLGLDTACLHLVVNRATASTGLSIDDIQSVLGIEAELRVPDDRRFGRALNIGSTIIDFDGSSDLAKPFQAFADRLLGLPAESGEHRWWKP